jgi:hypothetical protein
VTINFDEDEEGMEKWKHNYDPDLDLILRGKEGLQDEVWQGVNKNIGKGPNDCNSAIK